MYSESGLTQSIWLSEIEFFLAKTFVAMRLNLLSTNAFDEAGYQIYFGQ